MQPENDDRYEHFTQEQQLDMACDLIKNLLPHAMRNWPWNKDLKSVHTSMLKVAEMLGAYSGELEGPGKYALESFEHMREDFPDQFTASVPNLKRYNY